MSLHETTKALINCISDDENDYSDIAYYRMIMDKRSAVEDELRAIERAELKNKARQKLEERRRKIIEEEWESADLTGVINGYCDGDDLDIESDGWYYDGKNYFSRSYYASVNGNTSQMYYFAITFKDSSDEIMDIFIS